MRPPYWRDRHAKATPAYSLRFEDGTACMRSYGILSRPLSSRLLGYASSPHSYRLRVPPAMHHDFAASAALIYRRAGRQLAGIRVAADHKPDGPEKKFICERQTRSQIMYLHNNMCKSSEIRRPSASEKPLVMIRYRPKIQADCIFFYE